MEHNGSELVLNMACDYAEGRDADSNYAKKLADQCKNLARDTTSNLLYELRLIRDKKYMITSNIDVSDSLVNGSIGLLKKIVFSEPTAVRQCKVVRVYLSFEDEEIGQIARRLNLHKRNDQVEDNWTVFFSISVNIHRPSNGDFHIERNQLPIIECEAMNIHNSQGQTYSKCAVNIGNGLSKYLLYVFL